MAEIQLTPSQQAVVENAGGALLVSAAAGSGKTKVLVDRLMARICDAEHPCNIDSFLVITYTKAAAAELRVKIAQALSQRLAQAPENRHLQRQMHRLYLAEISTVHAFCANLLRTYAHQLDIPADFRVAEETESRVLQDKVLQRMLEEGYASHDPEFRMMVETFGYGRDDRRLPEAVLMAYREMRCRADMDGWLESTLGALDMERYSDAAATPWGAYILREFHVFLEHQIENFQRCLNEMSCYPNIEKGFGKTFRENLQQLEELHACQTWDEVLCHKVQSFGRAVVRNPEDSAVKERLAKIRTLCWSELKSWQELFFADSQAVLDDLSQVMPGAQALLRFTRRFERAYLEEKKSRKVLDFSDLEHTAIGLLVDHYTGKPTKTAREIAGRYEEILVDEYQDSNQVQDTIFEAVSRNGENRFMVGDVKQSIYRFRLADPTIFLKKYEAYKDYREALPAQPRKILLSDNFRSKPEILEACNDVFRLVMRKKVGDLDYGEAEALHAGRAFPETPQTPVELHCLTSSDPALSQDKCELEADYVARRIRRLLEEQTPVTEGDRTRPVKPGDIVILMRSLSGTASTYLESLSRYGIPAVCERGGSLLDAPEVQILVAILQIIDNPHQDVPLLTVLASPVFGYSPDVLAQPRTLDRKGDYYEAIQAAGGEFEPFLRLLEELREETHWLSLTQLLDSIFQKTDLLSVFAAMDDGLQRERNLMAFRSFAGSFEAGGSKALPQLLWYLSDLQANDGQLAMPVAAAENAVSIMTVHSSKGLEFPVVFLSDLSRRFNLKDMQDAILVDKDLAVGCNRVDHKLFVRYPTLAKKAIVLKKTREAVSEELRVLYVAMTRAKDMLVMTYYSKYLLSELKNINSQLTRPLSDDLCASARCPGKWILMAALCRTEAGELRQLVDGNDVGQVSKYPWRIVYRDLFQEAEQPLAAFTNQVHEDVQADPAAISLLQYSYPYAAVSALPAKLTATQLKGRLQDMEAAEGAVESRPVSSYRFQKARFLPGPLSAAEKGTATHLFMQFASYQACSTGEAIAAELDRLGAANFLTQDQADAVQIQQVEAFFHSELGTWLLAQPNIRREFKFSILVDAGDYDAAGSGEQTMLQGVVDCVVFEEDGMTILDFKTDHVYGDMLQQRASYYAPQLEAYSKALSRIFQMPVKRRILYFFSSGSAILV